MLALQPAAARTPKVMNCVFACFISTRWPSSPLCRLWRGRLARPARTTLLARTVPFPPARAMPRERRLNARAVGAARRSRAL